MRTLKLKAHPTNAFFATINQMSGSCSQLPTTAEHVVIKLLCTVQTTKHCLEVFGSWEEVPNIWLTVVKNIFVGWALNFKVCMLLKDTASPKYTVSNWLASKKLNNCNWLSTPIYMTECTDLYCLHVPTMCLNYFQINFCNKRTVSQNYIYNRVLVKKIIFWIIFCTSPPNGCGR